MHMKYRAKSNIYCAGQHYKAGEEYSEEEIKHLDPEDFEACSGKKEEKKEKEEKKPK